MLFLATVVSLSMLGCSKKETAKEKIVVLAASSLTDVLTELKTEYEQSHQEIELIFSFDSSGTLKSQIMEGVTADLFFSASDRQVSELAEHNLIQKESITDLLCNEVVLIAKKGSPNTISSFKEVVLDPKVAMIGTCMEEVPIGQYTKQLYEALGCLPQLEAKANYASNVRQVLSWVTSENVPYGIVYSTDAATVKDEVNILAVADASLCGEVLYQGAIIKASKNYEQTANFLSFLSSPAAQKIFREYGFTPAS